MRYFLLTPFLAFCFLLMNTGYSGGAAASGSVARSGAPTAAGGTEQTCNTCHNGGNYSPAATLQVFEAGTTTEATALRNSRTYDLKLTVSGTGVPVEGGYGFQLAAIKNTDKSDAGTFSAAGAGVQFSTLGTRVYAEHNAKSATGVFNFKWKPNATSGAGITFHFVGNVVNGSNSSAGDSPTFARSKAVNMAVANDAETPTDTFVVEVYPNPSCNMLSIKTATDAVIQVEIFNMLGKLIQSDTSASMLTKIPIETLASGIYFVRVTSGGQVAIKKFTKQ